MLPNNSLLHYIRFSTSFSSGRISTSSSSSSFFGSRYQLIIHHHGNGYTIHQPNANLATTSKSSSRRRPRLVESTTVTSPTSASSSSQLSSSPSPLLSLTKPSSSSPSKQRRRVSPPSVTTTTTPEPSQLLTVIVHEVNSLLACTPEALQGGKKVINILEIFHTLANQYIPFRQLTESSEFLQCLDTLAHTIDKVPSLWETKYLARTASLLTRLGKLYGLTRQQERYYTSSRLRRILRQITLLYIQRMDKIPPAYIADIVTSLARANIRYEPLFQSIAGWLIAEDAYLYPHNYTVNETLGKKDNNNNNPSTTTTTTTITTMQEFWLRCDSHYKYRNLAYQRIHNYTKWNSMISGAQANTLLDILWSMGRIGLPLPIYYPLYKLLFSYVLSTANKERLLNIELWYTKNIQQTTVNTQPPSVGSSIPSSSSSSHGGKTDVYTAFRQRSPSSSVVSSAASTIDYKSLLPQHSVDHNEDNKDNQSSNVNESLPFTYRNSPVHFACKLLSSLALLRVPVQKDLLNNYWSIPLSSMSSTDKELSSSRISPNSYTTGSMSTTHPQRYIEWLLNYPYGKENTVPPSDTELFTVTISFCFYSIIQEVTLLQSRHIATVLSNIHTLGIANTIDAAHVQLTLLERMRTLLNPQELSNILTTATNANSSTVHPHKNYISVFAPGEMSLALVSLAAQIRNYKYPYYPALYRSFIPRTYVGILDDIRTVQTMESNTNRMGDSSSSKEENEQEFITVKESNNNDTQQQNGTLSTESTSTTSSGTDWDSDNMDTSDTLSNDTYPNNDVSLLPSYSLINPTVSLPPALTKELEDKMDLLFILSRDTVLGNIKNASPNTLIQFLVAYTASLSEPLYPLVQYLCQVINTKLSSSSVLPVVPTASKSSFNTSMVSWLQTNSLDTNYLISLIWGLALNRKVEGPRLYPFISSSSVIPPRVSSNAEEEGENIRSVQPPQSLSELSSPPPQAWYMHPGPIVLHDSEAYNTHETTLNIRKSLSLIPSSSSSNNHHHHRTIRRTGAGATAVPLTSIQGTICTITEQLLPQIFDLSPQQLTTLLYSLGISGVYHAPLLSVCSERLLTPKISENSTTSSVATHELDSWSSSSKEQVALAMAMMICRSEVSSNYSPNTTAYWNRAAIDLFFMSTVQCIPQKSTDINTILEKLQLSGIAKRNPVVYITLLHLLDTVYETNQLSKYMNQTTVVVSPPSIGTLPPVVGQRGYQVLQEVLLYWLATLPQYKDLNLTSEELAKEIQHNVSYGEALQFHTVIPRLKIGFILNNSGTNHPYETNISNYRSVTNSHNNGLSTESTFAGTYRIPYVVSNAHRIWQRYILDQQSYRTVYISDIVLLGGNGIKGKLRYLLQQGLPNTV